MFRSFTVCASGCGYTSIQAAHNAAAPGDTIDIQGDITEAGVRRTDTERPADSAGEDAPGHPGPERVLAMMGAEQLAGRLLDPGAGGRGHEGVTGDDGVPDRAPSAVGGNLRARPGIQQPRPDTLDVNRQTRHSMGHHAARIGVHQNLGNHDGGFAFDAVPLEHLDG